MCKSWSVRLPTRPSFPVLHTHCTAALWTEQQSKVAFWQSTDFYGLDLTCLEPEAANDHFSQPVVGYVDPSSLLCASTVELTVDFAKDEPESLHEMVIPFDFISTRTAVCHGLACWFDVSFNGTDTQTVLSTAPSAPGTHWYQCRLVLKEPIALNAMQRVTGSLRMHANEKYSYNLTLNMYIAGSEMSTADHKPISSTVQIRLQDQMYHYLNSTTSAYSYGST